MALKTRRSVQLLLHSFMDYAKVVYPSIPSCYPSLPYRFWQQEAVTLIKRTPLAQNWCQGGQTQKGRCCSLIFNCPWSPPWSPFLTCEHKSMSLLDIAGSAWGWGKAWELPLGPGLGARQKDCSHLKIPLSPYPYHRTRTFNQYQ